MGLWFRIRLGPFGYTVRGRRKRQSYRAYKASRNRRAAYAARYAAETGTASRPRSKSRQAESAWLGKFIAFTAAEAAGQRADPSSQRCWIGAAARLQTSVGPAPTARTQSVYQTMLAACTQLESAATDGDARKIQEAHHLFNLASEQLAAVTEEANRTG